MSTSTAAHRGAFGGRIAGPGRLQLKTVDYLDAVKRRLKIESDYALAQRLELTRQAISLFRNRGTVMSNTTAAKIAELLELDPLRVIADAELERGSDDQLWKRLRESAAAVLVAIGALSPAPDAQAARFDITLSALSVYTLRALAAWLAAALFGRHARA